MLHLILSVFLSARQQSFYQCCASVKTQVAFAGATFFDWTKDGVDEDQEIPVQLQLDPDTFAAEMEAKGVGTDRPVVVRPLRF